MLRYGIIGCGAMGREHIENIKALGDGSAVTALADPHAASIDAALALFKGLAAPRGFMDHQALLDSKLCDVVVIASPNYTHIAVLRDALQTDLPILVEKPLVTRMADGFELLQLAQGRRAITWVAQEYRYMPPVAELVRMVHAGQAGTVHQVAIREHRQPFYPKVADWNRFNRNTGGTLVEKCCHYFNLMDLILRERPLRVFASGGQRVNHLDERYGGETPDILDSAFVIVEYPSGARASLDLCMFAENTVDNEHLSVTGDLAKIESMVPALTLRYGVRADWGKPAVWGEATGTGRGVDTRRIWDTNIRYAGQHFGASYIEHQRFADAVKNNRPPEIPLEEGLRAVATGIAAHKSIDEGRVVGLSEVLASLPV